jgi:type I site-specific restriction endonuclease
MLNLNELQTREQNIDVLLKEHGWNVSDMSKVIAELIQNKPILKNSSISW